MNTKITRISLLKISTRLGHVITTAVLMSPATIRAFDLVIAHGYSTCCVSSPGGSLLCGSKPCHLRVAMQGKTGGALSCGLRKSGEKANPFSQLILCLDLGLHELNDISGLRKTPLYMRAFGTVSIIETAYHT